MGAAGLFSCGCLLKIITNSDQTYEVSYVFVINVYLVLRLGYQDPTSCLFGKHVPGINAVR